VRCVIHNVAAAAAAQLCTPDLISHLAALVHHLELQLYFRQTSSKTAVKQLNTATLSDWATITQTFCTNGRPENRLKMQ